MRKLLFILTLFPLTLIGQNYPTECQFVPSDEMYNINHFSRTVRSLADFSTNEPLVLNVKFHIVRDDNGNNVYGVTEEDLLTSIARLNNAFNIFNIFFKYRGYTNIDDSEYLQCYGAQNNQPTAWDLRVRSFDPNDTHYDYSCINVFVTGIGSGAIHEYSDVFLKYTVLNGPINNITTIIHEFSHALGLLHIFEGTMGTVDFVYDNLPDCNIPLIDKMAKPNFNGYTPQPFFPSGPENVTRDPDDPNYNADVAGDFVVDTNASFRGLNTNCCTIEISVEQTVYEFQTNPAVVDQTGEMYVDLDDERTNYMHYGSETNHFSNGQGVRMRESIENDINGHLQEKLTPIASLYEPYKGEYRLVGPEQSTNLSPQFQWGFDYDFVPCSGVSYNQPSDFDDISFSFDNRPQYSYLATDRNLIITYLNHTAYNY